MNSMNINAAGVPAVDYRTYWEERAQRFAGDGDGLRAVCSYGMPAFYNRAIDLCQQLALRRWLAVAVDTPVLDVGCGVGRWSLLLAARGAQVTGVDLSSTMVAEATRRAMQQGHAARCRFLAQDLAELALEQRFELVLGVTVLQHIIDRERLASALSRLAQHLSPSGRMVLLEAAPSRAIARCDSPIFHARTLADYRGLLEAAGLRIETVTGVDPMPLKTLFLPYYARLPRPLAHAGLAAVTAASVPIDAMFGRRWVDASWHKVLQLRHA